MLLQGREPFLAREINLALWLEVRLETCVGADSGARVGDVVLVGVDDEVGDRVGADVGACVGADVGAHVGADVGARVGDVVVAGVGDEVNA